MLTLAFAAEQACAAAQLLNNHAIAPVGGRRLCYDKCVFALFQHTHFLPAVITGRLECARANTRELQKQVLAGKMLAFSLQS